MELDTAIQMLDDCISRHGTESDKQAWDIIRDVSFTLMVKEFESTPQENIERPHTAALADIVEKCGACGGEGFEYIEVDGDSEREPCNECNGSGYVIKIRKDEVDAIMGQRLAAGAGTQQLKAKIAAIADKLESFHWYSGYDKIEAEKFADELRQHSAI